jgi:hypothetical protein
MGGLTVPSRRVKQHYKRTVLEHPGKLAMTKHGINIGHCGQYPSPYVCVCVYIYLYVILIIHFILSPHFIVFLWLSSPVLFQALLFTLFSQLPFYAPGLFLCVLPPHFPLAQPELCLDSPSCLADVCLLYTWLIYQP